MIRALLLDRDDTISVDEPAVYSQAAQWFAQEYGQDKAAVLKAMQQHWQENFGSWWNLRTIDDERRFWAEYGEGLAARLGLGAEVGAALVEKYPYTAFMRPVPGLRDFLAGVRSRGLKVGILSNTLPDIVPTLEAIGVADLVDVALSSCALGVHKPAPEVFTIAAAELGVAPGEILFIDDKQENVDAARSVGMSAQRINLHEREEGALHRIEDVLEHL